MRRIGTGLFAAIALTAACSATAGGDETAGAALADRLCARCHATATGPSPVADAPPFSEFASKWPIEHLAEALAEGLVMGHRDDARTTEFVFSPEEIDDLLAYLESIQGAGADRE